MPVMIEELTSRIEIRDEAKMKKLVREEIKSALAEERRRFGSGGKGRVDPADPSAGGRPNEGG